MNKRAIITIVTALAICVEVYGQTSASSGPETDLGNWLFAAVSGVRTWTEYDSIHPPDGMGESWKSGETVIQDFSMGSPMIAGSTRVTIGDDEYRISVKNFVSFSDSKAPLAKGVYREVTVWISNKGRKPAGLDMVVKGADNLDVQLILPDKTRLAPYGFRFPSMGEFEASLATGWEGKLGFTLEPGKKTWMLLLFDVPKGIDAGHLQIKKAAPLKVKLAK